MNNKVTDTYVTDEEGTNYSMWQMAYGSVMCNQIIDPEGRKACFIGGIPEVKIPPFDNLTTEQKNQVWVAFRNMYAAERDVHVNEHIAAHEPLANETNLINAGYILRFPSSNEKIATQYDWGWYESAPNPPNGVNLEDGSLTEAAHTFTCESYISQWKQMLSQCDQINTQILQEITDGMVAVCKKGIDAANPNGSSTVAPSTPEDGSPRSFEEVIERVFANHSINRSMLCNPYLIESPKPYNAGPKMIEEIATVIDTCNCERMAELKAEAAAANYDPNNLESFNDYLEEVYKGTITQVLYDAFAKCDSLNIEICSTVYTLITYDCNTTPPCSLADRYVDPEEDPDPDPETCSRYCPSLQCTTTSFYYPLSSPQPMPEFLKCGFIRLNTCTSCAELSSLTEKFHAKFPNYPNAPYFTGDDLSVEQIDQNVLYQRFINFHTGYYYTWMDYAKKADEANCDLANYTSNGTATQDVICRDTTFVTDTTGVFIKESPCEKVRDMAIAIAENIYEKRVERLLNDFEAMYRAKCLSAGSLEHFTVKYLPKEYHYTLYYYDQAGNLVKTVPPNGVRPLSATELPLVKSARADGTSKVPVHELITNYRYNSLNQVVEQNTPDAKTSRFWYDRLGRLVVSQNAQQAVDNKYSYTLYDDLGRIEEVGQKPQTSVMTQTICQNQEDLDNWINTGEVREQITITGYDLPYGEEPDNDPIFDDENYFTQKNLRNRVSFTMTKDLVTDDYQHAATFYTYDIHGNVDALLQDFNGIEEMKSAGHRYKLIRYDYDLISGKVNMVNYQPGNPDAFYQRYGYDAENRLSTVETSRDKLIWERDAFYRYYKHGPMSRMELGKQQVQGVDYAYTLQGWLKGINSTYLVPGKDIYRDGSATSTVARDVFGFALHYYTTAELEDYRGINYETVPFATPKNSSFKSLFNGNIAGISMNNGGLAKGETAATNSLPLFYNYSYDQLNRLVSMAAYKGLSTNNVWNPVAIDDYNENITYDPNGNITDYVRNGSPSIAGKQTAMDNLHYNYYPNTNQLRQVTDNPSGNDANYAEDVDNQDNISNYGYDQIGNLTSDEASGTTIEWTVYGKISGINKGGNTIYYTYDAAGNRISKTVGDKTTVYVRDASGNVMSIYDIVSEIGKEVSYSVKQSELHLYGSSRLGIWMPGTTEPVTPPVVHTDFGTGLISTFTRGEKLFELSNHLGNVLVTVSDKRYAYSTSGNTITSYKAHVITETDYYPFGMQMPGRTYNSSSYRYSINGQEKETELNENITTAEFWEYDSRIGRRWNLDPRPMIGISAYSAFANNPIWFSDPFGDTLSNGQLVDALKIASNEIKSRIKNKQGFYNDDAKNNLGKAILAYEEKNQLNLGDFGDFQEAVNGYYNGLGTIAMVSTQAYETLDAGIINNKSVNNKNTIIASVYYMRQYEKQLNSIMGSSQVPVQLIMGEGALPGAVGPGLRGVQFNSAIQREIVESQAGFKFTETTIKRYLDPSRTVNAADMRRVIDTKGYPDPQGAAGATAHYGTILRNGNQYNIKIVYSAENNTIYHFHYSRSAMGPLPKIVKPKQ